MCDLSQQGAELVHCWEHTVGSCHAPIALRADWQEQLRRCQAELGFRDVRFHGLLWLGRLYEGQHEPLVSRDLFERVQRVFVAANHPPTEQSASTLSSAC